MACTRDKSLLKSYQNQITKNNRYQCKQPALNFTPVIYSLSVYTCKTNTYTVVYITGENFLPNGNTFVNFGDYTKIPIVYYSSYNISFVVPINAQPNIYNVVVVNNV